MFTIHSFETYAGIVCLLDLNENRVLYLNRKGREIFCKEKKTEDLTSQDISLFFVESSTLEEEKGNNSFSVKEAYAPSLKKSYRLTKYSYRENHHEKEVRIYTDNTKAIISQEKFQYLQQAQQNVFFAIEEALKETNPEASLNILIKETCLSFHAERAYIFEKNDKDGFDNTYEYCRKGASSLSKQLQNIPILDHFEDWYQSIEKEGVLLIPDVEEYGRNCPDPYAILRLRGLKTLALTPIVVQGKITGFFGFDNLPKDTLAEMNIPLALISRFISTLLLQRENYHLLSSLSYQDSLTGAKNRFALYDFLGKRSDEKFTFFFCDINHLKKTNDEQGHQAGDFLIQRTASVLFDTFGKENVYRIGGDEFLAIHSCLNNRECLEAKYKLKELFKENNCLSAIGTFTQKEPSENFDSFFSTLDKSMYEDKKLDHSQPIEA